MGRLRGIGWLAGWMVGARVYEAIMWKNT